MDIAANLPMLRTIQFDECRVTIYNIKFCPFEVTEKPSKFDVQTKAILGTRTLFDRRMLEPLYRLMKDVLDKKYRKVGMSSRLVSLLHCIVSSQYGWTANIEKIIQTQTVRGAGTIGYVVANLDHTNLLKNLA